MSSPLERAARALCELAGNPPGATMNGKPLWVDYLPEVRAVIAAIREPSDVMLDAAEDMEAQSARGTAGNMWSAMIGAMLEE